MRWFTLVLCSLLIVAWRPPDVAAQSNKWWQSEEVRRELDLSDEASARIEEVFQATWPELRSAWRELSRLEKALDTLLSDSEATEAIVSPEIDHVESVRCHLRKTRTLMLFKMQRVLTTEQRAKLKAFNERRRSERRGRDRDDRHERR